jgi:hypothetical protein
MPRLVPGALEGRSRPDGLRDRLRVRPRSRQLVRREVARHGSSSVMRHLNCFEKAIG